MAGDDKCGSWVGMQSKGYGGECYIDGNKLLNIDLLNLCLKQKRDIAELFLDTTVFFDEKNCATR